MTSEELIADALSDYVDLLNAGKAPPIESYLATINGDIANELRPLLFGAANLHQLFHREFHR
jgi:hypothetical protein